MRKYTAFMNMMKGCESWLFFCILLYLNCHSLMSLFTIEFICLYMFDNIKYLSKCFSKTFVQTVILKIIQNDLMKLNNSSFCWVCDFCHSKARYRDNNLVATASLALDHFLKAYVLEGWRPRYFRLCI